MPSAFGLPLPGARAPRKAATDGPQRVEKASGKNGAASPLKPKPSDGAAAPSLSLLWALRMPTSHPRRVGASDAHFASAPRERFGCQWINLARLRVGVCFSVA